MSAPDVMRWLVAAVLVVAIVCAAREMYDGFRGPR